MLFAEGGMELGREIVYMLGVVAAGFAVNYTLRALPFILFAGRNRELPGWAVKFGNVISPIIIAGLIVYSYSGLQWKTAWPYLAGALTVALHLWKRNALVSIVAGTVLYMFLVAGCSTAKPIAIDAKDPSVAYTARGVELDGQVVSPLEVVEALEDNDIPHDRVIHIRLAPDARDLMGARTLMGVLAASGYNSPVLVMERHGESYSTGKKKVKSSGEGEGAKGSSPRKIKYKRGDAD